MKTESPTEGEPEAAAGSADAGSESEATPLQRRGMRNAILAQVFGCVSYVVFQNGMLLLYFTVLDISSIGIMVYLALPGVAQALLLIPCAFLADRYGKKRVGHMGSALMVIGFASLAMAGFGGTASIHLLVAFGTTAYGMGLSLFIGGWFALLHPLVPSSMRGSFFGRLRFSWQSTAIVFGAIGTALLSRDTPIHVFQIIVVVIAVCFIIRVIFYQRIPEVEASIPRSAGFGKALGEVVRAKGYASFCCYIFLLTLFTAHAPVLFGLIEKKGLGLGDNQVAWMGNVLAMGSVAGFLLGGRMVDRWGTKPVFLYCHFAYGATLFLFLARDLLGVPVIYPLYVLNGVFGVVVAASSIAISTEMLELSPRENRSLATAVCMTLFWAGTAFSGLLSAGAIRLGIFKDEWEFFGNTLTAFDSLLLIFGVLVVLLVVSLGLVPSVMRKAEWVPKGD